MCSVARKNSVNLQMSKHTQLLFQEIFLWQKFPENVLTYLWERDMMIVIIIFVDLYTVTDLDEL